MEEITSEICALSEKCGVSMDMLIDTVEQNTYLRDLEEINGVTEDVRAPSADTGENGDNPITSTEVRTGARRQDLEDTFVTTDSRELSLDTVGTLNL